MSRWFRFYDDAINDPKILKLSDKLHRVWIGILCVASKNNGQLPSLDDMALMIRMKPEKLADAIKSLMIAGLIDEEDTILSPHNWSERQYKSDSSAERMKRHRDKQRDVTVTVQNRTEQRQITETEQRVEARAKRATRLPDAWVPTETDLVFATSKGLAMKQIETEALKFLNYWTSKSGQGATKIDWSKTWQNWILTATQGIPTNGRRTVHDAAKDLTRTLQRVAEFDEPAPGGLCLEEGGNAVRLLPPR